MLGRSVAPIWRLNSCQYAFWSIDVGGLVTVGTTNETSPPLAGVSLTDLTSFFGYVYQPFCTPLALAVTSGVGPLKGTYVGSLTEAPALVVPLLAARVQASS